MAFLDREFDAGTYPADQDWADTGPWTVPHADESADTERRRILTEMFSLHHRGLCAFITRRVGNPDDAHDIVQSAYFEAYRCLPKFQGRSNLKTWLYGITLNIMRNHLSRSPWRDHASIDDPDVEALADAMPSPNDTYRTRDEMRRVLRALEEAPEDQRETLLLVSVDGLSYGDAAARLGVPIGTVRSRVSRLRATLREIRD